MKVISPKAHGVMDYLVGIVLLASPWLFGFAYGGPETAVPVTLGIVTLVYSLFTAYEMGAVKLLSFRAHLVLDALSGLFLIASPWLFNFNERVMWPHVIFGILEVGVVIMTQRQPQTVVRKQHA